MANSPQKIAFASGKGGVGKTLLAANFARLASTRLRCVLLDLDLQNQGSSGLLSGSLRPGCTNAFDMLNGGPVDIENIIEISPQLWFIPSFEPNRTDRFALQLNPMFLSLGLRAAHSAL